MVGLTPFLSGDTATPSLPSKGSTGTRLDAGPYIGIVKSNIDPTRMGRLSVLIPALANTYDPVTEQLIVCEYLSPFYGAKTTKYLDESNPYDYHGSQHSYGMWMVPPDIDTKVLVIFAEGRAEQAFWIGCIQDPLVNQMVPGIGASDQTGLSDTGVDEDSKESVYGSNIVPAGEINRATLDRIGNKSANPKIKRPVHPFAEILRMQGLVQDDIRGTTTSSARRESPSQVFGMSTPGRRDPTAKDQTVGVSGSKHKEKIDRLTGHTFVLDDGDINGRNQLIRLRSATGHQILLNDTAGVVYISNGSGNAWMEFAGDGSIDIYSGGSVAVRSSGNMDFHSDANINMFAKEQIKLAAGQKIVIDGGQQIMTYADGDIQHQALHGSVTTKAPEGAIISYAGAMQLHMAKDQHHLTGSQVHFNSIPTMSDAVGTYYRTRFYDASGTGTLNTPIPDVDLTKKFRNVPLTVDQNLNITMDGMRVPTHEPFYGHRDKIISFAGGEFNALSLVPGTPDFVAQLNRTSDNPMVRAAQMQADMKVNLQSLGLAQGTGNIKKLQTAATEFVDNYAKKYNIPTNLNLSQGTETVSSVINQTIGAVTGKATNLLQNQIFVNQGGTLFTAGNLNQAVTGTVSNAINDLTSLDNFTATAGNVLRGSLPDISNVTGITGNINLGELTKLTGNLSANNLKTTAINTAQGYATSYASSYINSAIGDTFKNAGSNVLFGQAPMGDFDLGTKGIFGSYGQAGLGGGSLEGLGSVAQSGLNTVTNTYKNVVGSSVTSVTQVTSLVSNIGSKISTTIASIGTSIGKMFGF